jgi:hypothetical protein
MELNEHQFSDSSPCEVCGGTSYHPSKELMQQHGLTPTQTAKQLFGKIEFEDHDNYYSSSSLEEDRALLKEKYQSAVEDGLKDDILKNGVQEPLDMFVSKAGRLKLTDGHHRFAVMLKHRPSTPIPIHYWSGE